MKIPLWRWCRSKMLFWRNKLVTMLAWFWSVRNCKSWQKNLHVTKQKMGIREVFGTLKFCSSLIDIRHIWYRLCQELSPKKHPLEAQGQPSYLVTYHEPSDATPELKQKISTPPNRPGCNGHKWRCIRLGFPEPKNVILQLVTVTGWGGRSNTYLPNVSNKISLLPTDHTAIQVLHDVVVFLFGGS